MMKKMMLVVLATGLVCGGSVQAMNSKEPVKYGQMAYVYVKDKQGSNMFLNMAQDSPRLDRAPSTKFRIGGGNAGEMVKNGGRIYLLPMMQGARGYDGMINILDGMGSLMFNQPFQQRGLKGVAAAREWGRLFDGADILPKLHLMPAN
ncbi:MAG: hypothetical protein H6679_04305 [Epsilonproteobacteria bacterium]|nr:hypothetical protein [Campylobacterota bacterium]